LEAIIALLLISIILYSIFVYNQRGVENILVKRTLTRSVAGSVAGIYVNYLNNTQNFHDFNNSVSDFLTYIGEKENVSCPAYLRLLFKNGTYFSYQLIRGRGGKTSITENITVALGNISGSPHVYALVNRSFISTVQNIPVGVYVVAYYDDGVPPISLTASVSISDGSSSQPCTLERSFTGGRAIYSCYAPSTSIDKEVQLYISVNNIVVDGKPYPDISLIIEGKPLTYTKSVMIKDTGTDPSGASYRYVDYYLGEIVNLTDYASWVLQNRKGMHCTGYYGNSIPTGSSYLCPEGNLPLPVFLVQGPINISLDCDSDERVCSRQVIFIEPYFSQISVTLAKG
jgi:hypothetical protein